MTVFELIQNSDDMWRLRAVKLHNGYISTACVSPDYLLCEVSQTKEIRLSKYTTSRVGLHVYIQIGVGIYAALTTGTVATAEISWYTFIVRLR